MHSFTSSEKQVFLFWIVAEWIWCYYRLEKQGKKHQTQVTVRTVPEKEVELIVRIENYNDFQCLFCEICCKSQNNSPGDIGFDGGKNSNFTQKTCQKSKWGSTLFTLSKKPSFLLSSMAHEWGATSEQLQRCKWLLWPVVLCEMI